MSHFAVVAPPYPSHFQALQALAGELVERGHRVSFFHQPAAQRWLSDPRIGFVAVGHGRLADDHLEQTLRLAAIPSGPMHLRRLIDQLASTGAMLCACLPEALAAQQVDAMLCDQMEPAGALAAEVAGIPWISIACALPINREPGIPLPVMPFDYGQSRFKRRLYRGSTEVFDWLMQPLGRVLRQACREHGLVEREGLHDWLSPLAQISQTVPSFDFPRQALPAHFHAVGPLRVAAQQDAADWPLDPARPLVFASLGTLQGHRFDLFSKISQACQALDVQLLIAHCGGLDHAQQAHLRQQGATFVTDFAPQQWAVRRADVVISHGGLNTVLDAIAAATPLLVMPIAFDQPGVAARVAYHRLGVALSRRASVSAIRSALAHLLREPLPRLTALQRELATAGGAAKAADIVEAALRSQQPILAENSPCITT